MSANSVGTAAGGSAQPQAAFQYDILAGDDERPEIRLLQLLPGNEDTPIFCEIQTLKIQYLPLYEALSYVWTDHNTLKLWGEDSYRQKITLNGRPFQVLPNLYNALRRIRLQHQVRTIWVDAICINQLSNPERNQQIKLMRKIYQQAQATLVVIHRPWLERVVLDEHGLQLVTQMAAALGQFDKMGLVSGRDDHSIKRLKTNLQLLGLPPISGGDYLQLLSILDNSYFRRVWILQEIAVARQVKVFLMEHEIDWAELEDCIKLCFKLGIDANVLDPVQFRWIMLVIKLREKVQNKYSFNPVSLFHSFRTSQASDLSDKVFALCGLLDNKSPAITADYSISTASVYKNVAKTILLNHEGLDLLTVPRVLKPEETTSLPSWVPDWSRSTTCAILEPDSRYDFKASRNSTRIVSFDEDDFVLRVNGMCADRIVSLSPVLRKRYSINLDEEYNNSLLNQRGWSTQWLEQQELQNQRAEENIGALQITDEWVRMAHKESKQPYPTGETRMDVFRKTLVVGYELGGEAASRAAFNRWYQQHRLAIDILRRSTRALLGGLLFLAKHKLTGEGRSDEFEKCMYPTLERRLAWTEKGYLALVPDISAIGDEVWLISGCKLPLILQRWDQANSDGSHYHSLIGAAYVHGLMNGEGYEEAKCCIVKLR